MFSVWHEGIRSKTYQIQIFLLNCLYFGNDSGKLLSEEHDDFLFALLPGVDEEVWLKGQGHLEAGAVHFDEEVINGCNQPFVFIEDLRLSISK